MSKGINGWKAFILKFFMKIAWLIIKVLEILLTPIVSIFTKK